MLGILEWLGYPTLEKVWWWSVYRYNTERDRRTDGQTDWQTELLYQYRDENGQTVNSKMNINWCVAGYVASVTCKSAGVSGSVTSNQRSNNTRYHHDTFKCLPYLHFPAVFPRVMPCFTYCRMRHCDTWCDYGITPSFLPRDAMHSADYALAVCPSVRLSHAGIMSKRFNVPIG